MITKKIKFILATIREHLPDYENFSYKDYKIKYKFKKYYKDNHFFSYPQDPTENDIKCHMLAGKWSVLEPI